MSDNIVDVEKFVKCNDSRLDYCFIKKEELEDSVNKRPVMREWLDKDLIDYDIVVKKEEDDDQHTVGIGQLDTTLPSSYCAIKTVEDGINWYQRKYPELPDAFYEIIARYTWGDNTQDKGDDLAPVKKSRRKRKNRHQQLKISKGKFQVKFD
mgnify:CR=1 FL=1